MSDPYDWTRQELLQEVDRLREQVETLNQEVIDLKAINSKHVDVTLKYTKLKRSIIKMSLRNIETITDLE